MNKEQIFTAWAPDASPWSTWAKPVLFAHLDMPDLMVPNLETLPLVNWAPKADGTVAIILDLPSDEGVRIGLALAKQGYRPVPLYNAVPASTTPEIATSEAYQRWVAVDVRPIISALGHGAATLALSNLPDSAPPVFLLDQNRSGGRHIESEGFDNRSICFATDFPSANFLLGHRIERILLIQRNGLEPQRDLSHPLYGWQKGGLKLERMNLDAPGSVESFHVPRPSWFGAMFLRALAIMRLRRGPQGGFGNWLHQSGSGG